MDRRVNPPKSTKSPLGNGPTGIISHVLDYGVPPNDAREIEILNTGGGPERAPAEIYLKYYYSGSREFQGPRLPGGPTVIQGMHPRTGCKFCKTIMLPPGAPTVEYMADAIDLSYADVEVQVTFGRRGDVDVSYSHFDRRVGKLMRVAGGVIVAPYQVVRDSPPGQFAGKVIEAGLGVGDFVLQPLRGAASRLPILSDAVRTDKDRVPNTLDPVK